MLFGFDLKNRPKKCRGCWLYKFLTLDFIHLGRWLDDSCFWLRPCTKPSSDPVPGVDVLQFYSSSVSREIVVYEF